MPALGELLYAEHGKGAFLNGNLVHVSTVDTLSEAYLSYGTLKYFTAIGKQETLLSFSERLRWKRSIGDCWAYHLLAQGKIDILTEGRVKIWDIAPFKVIIEEAGGKMTQLDGSHMDVNTTNTIATNGLLHDRILAVFQ